MNRSYIYALLVVGVLSVYMLTGLVGCGGSDGSAAVMADAQGKPVMTVRVRESQAQIIPREVTVPGHTEPARAVTLRAEASGTVERIGAQRGSYLQKGDLILGLAKDDREERLEEARALLEQRRIEYAAAQRLRERDLQSEGALAEAFANLKTAEQELRAIEIEVEDLELRAPFDGVLHERTVEEGDFVSTGMSVGRFLELSPIVVRGDVTELQIQYLHPGEEGFARLPDGREVRGTIRYVGAEADDQTRTFPIELEVSNPEGAIPAGVSADIRVETEQVRAHRVSLAVISIADDGRFGVKYVDEDNVVQFAEADIVRSSPSELWLAGLPETVDLITVGQGFTKEGDLVKTEPDMSPWN